MDKFRIGALAGAALLVGAVASAQTTGTVCGTVTNASGAVQSGVTVSLMPALDRSVSPVVATTDPQGNYRVSKVAPGTYTLTFESSGFKKVVQTNLIVAAGGWRRADRQMEPGAAAGQAPMAPSVPVDYGGPKTGGTFTATRTGVPPTPPRPCGQ
jgi:hypothetical protein